MSSLTGRYRAFRASPHFTRIWKFAAVSLIATAVSQTMLFIFYPHVLDTAMGANVVATCISTVPAYYLNRRWTWGKRGKSHLWKEVMPFWIIALVGLVLSTVIVGIAAKNADRISSSHEVKIIVVHLANLFSYALIWVARYSILNRFLFGPATQTPSSDAIVDTVAVEQPAPPASLPVVVEPALVPRDPSSH
ncbi:MAG: GtrA family protein [Acidimicrobiales bacterium]|jgi:putative flippase GtrA